MEKSISSSIYVTTEKKAEIYVNIPYLNITMTKYVRRSRSTKIEISKKIQMSGGYREKKGILLTANTTVSVYATNAGKTSRDTYVLYPTSTLGVEHVVVTYTPKLSHTSKDSSLVGIIAMYDNTLIQMKLRIQGNLIYDGKTYYNGDVIRIFLNSLETFQLKSKKDLTGTLVISTRPVVVLGGNRCVKIETASYCSHLATQLIPVSKWGTRFLTSPTPNRDKSIDGDIFRVVAAFNGTHISIGSENFTLNSGEYKEFKVQYTDAKLIESSKPAMLIQYNRGSSGRYQSEPFARMLPSIVQYTNSYNLPIPVAYVTPPFSNHLTFIVKTSEREVVEFDSERHCREQIESMEIPGTEYSTYTCPLNISTRVWTVISLRSKSKGVRLLAYIVGHNDFDGYGYSGGMEMNDINKMRLFKYGDEYGIEEDIINTRGCDFHHSTVPYIQDEFINGSTIKNMCKPQNSCTIECKRTYSFKAPDASEIIVARQTIRWSKQMPNIVIPSHVKGRNTSFIEEMVRNMSTMCPGDSLDYEDEHRNLENGTQLINRKWFVREMCGRVTRQNQTILGKNCLLNNSKDKKMHVTVVCFLTVHRHKKIEEGEMSKKSMFDVVVIVVISLCVPVLIIIVAVILRM